MNKEIQKIQRLSDSEMPNLLKKLSHKKEKKNPSLIKN